jgi:hypothetical protein
MSRAIGQKSKSQQEPPLSNTRRKVVGKVPITGAELRAGILNGGTWPKIFEQNNEKWALLGGCELSTGKSEECKNPTFNYFPTSKDAVIEWSEEAAPSHSSVAASKAQGAVIDVAKMPYLNHPATKLRPTLLAFEITGHVMLGIVYNYEGALGPTIHILNPWRLTADKSSTSDVFTLVDTAMGKNARKVIIVDVVGELEEKFKYTINLQEFEKQGFCTLWVGILATAVIPRLTELQASVSNTKQLPGAGQQLNDATLNIYNQVYTGIEQEWMDIVKETKESFGEDVCTPSTSAANAVYRMAQEAQKKGGKRKAKRQTRRKRLYKSKWTKKRRNLQ